jgi:hypothetical protein
MSSVIDTMQILSSSNARKLASETHERCNVNQYPIPIESITKEAGVVVKCTRILSDGALARTKENYIRLVAK